MKVKIVTVSYGETASLPGYSNFKSQITYEAELAPDEDYTAAQLVLHLAAKTFVQDVIDSGLEDAGGSPKYTTQTLYQIYSPYYVHGEQKTWRLVAPAGLVVPGHNSTNAPMRHAAILRRYPFEGKTFWFHNSNIDLEKLNSDIVRLLEKEGDQEAAIENTYAYLLGAHPPIYDPDEEDIDF